MLTQPITVVCHANVGGPNGKLFANNVYVLEDSDYVRMLIKSGNVSLVDPPSLDPTFLEQAGYQLCEGYVYADGVVLSPQDQLPEEITVPWFSAIPETPKESEPTNASKVASGEIIETPPMELTEPAETAATKAAKDSEETSKEEKDDSQEGESDK